MNKPHQLETSRIEAHFHRPIKLRTEVRILVVLDASGTFGPEDFGLEQLITIIEGSSGAGIVFRVTKAHRQSSDDAGVILNFRFNTHDLAQYSQIWLFGVSREGDPLSPAELRALTQFMDAGGGVFATGDHEDLGRAMCGEVPRVRSMRRWHHPNPGPNGEPVAPNQIDETRHDTVMNLGFGGSQEDAVPQPIRPKPYTRKVGGGVIRRVLSYPHPILCGPDGPIIWLPDHMHEGLCEVPSDLTKSWTFDGYTSPEYPAANGTHKPPEVIAWATDRNSGNGEFGVLCAYDGHEVNVGRVFVDATWHHWFNVNLQGFIDATNLPMPDPIVVAQWNAIKAYFRNVAVWLASPTVQAEIRHAQWLASLRHYELLMTHNPRLRVKDEVAYFWQMGVFARNALLLRSSRCEVTFWIVEILERLPFKLNPWDPIIKDPPLWLDIVDYETIALGGAFHQLFNIYSDVNEPKAVEKIDIRETLSQARRGAQHAVGEFLRRQQLAGQEAAELLASFDAR